MTTLQLLAEWTLRSAVLILGGALLLWIFRPRDAAVRLAAWVAMLFGSIAMPLLTATLPGFSVSRASRPALVQRNANPPGEVEAAPMPSQEPAVSPVDWTSAAV